MKKNSESHVFHRSCIVDYPVAVRGEGVYLYDAEGKRYLDGSGGAAVSCLGHSNQEVRDAIHQQIDAMAYAHTGFFSNEPMEKFADFLIERAPKGMDRVLFYNGGSEAVEAAIKLARQYFLEIGKPKKYKIVARWQSYHGNTLGALSAGGNKWRRQQFEPLLIDINHIPPCYEYRDRREGETAEEYGVRVANRLEEEIIHNGSSSIAAFIAEPVVGATMGCVPAVKGYLKRIREICDKYEVLLILDEVMCGSGRTGYLFACEEDGVVPDMVTMAKAIGGGYQPMAATIVQKKIHDAVVQGSGFFQHGHTYIGHATACVAALKVQQIIERDKLLDNVKVQGKKLRTELESIFGQHPHVGDIRGRGLFLGLELVEDRESKKPFDPEKKVAAKIKAAAMKEGLMCYPMAGTIDGKRGAHIMLAPPYIIEDKHIDELIAKLSKAIEVGLVV